MSQLSSFCNLILSCIGVLLGLSASVAFYIYGNNAAVFWAFFSACLASLNAHLHYLMTKGKLEDWHTEHSMSAIKGFALILTAIITAFLTWYIFRIFYEHLHIYPIKDSLIISSVWTFMSAKWAFMLFVASHKYTRFLSEVNTPLLRRLFLRNPLFKTSGSQLHVDTGV